MKNEFVQYAIIEHESYAGEGTEYIIGTLNVPEDKIGVPLEELKETLQDVFKEWYKYTYGEYPYATSLRWWTFETAVVKISTNKNDILNHFY